LWASESEIEITVAPETLGRPYGDRPLAELEPRHQVDVYTKGSRRGTGVPPEGGRWHDHTDHSACRAAAADRLDRGTLGIRAGAEAGKNGFTRSGSLSLFQIVFQARAGWTCAKWPADEKGPVSRAFLRWSVPGSNR
jgi:hypothetical protein